MKLNETMLKLDMPKNRCCLNTFAAKFPEPDHNEGEDETDPPNPDVEVGDSFTCAHCGNIIFLTETGQWESSEPALVEAVIDLTNPVLVV